MNKKVLRSDTLLFLKDENINKKVITIGKSQFALIIQNVGSIPTSKAILSGRSSQTLQDFYQQCELEKETIFIELVTDTSKRFWEIIMSCFGFSPKQFIYDKVKMSFQKYRLKIHSIIANDQEPLHAQKFIDANQLSILAYDDIPRDKLEYFLPFYKFIFFNNLKLLCVDQIFYSHSKEYLKDFDDVYENESAPEEINDIYFQHFSFYDRITRKLKKTATSVQIDMKKVIHEKGLDDLGKKIHVIEQEIQNIKDDALSNPFLPKRETQDKIISLHQTLFDMKEYRTILEKAAIKEDFAQSTSISIDIIDKVNIQILTNYKDKYRKIKIINRPKILLKENDRVRVFYQDNQLLNDNYIVTSANPDLIVENIKSLTFFGNFEIIHVDKDEVEKLFYNKLKETVVAVSDKDFSSHEIVWFKDINVRAHLFKETGGKSRTIAVLYNGLEESRRNLEHGCFGDSTIENSDVCKRKGYIWDRRCTSNYDCPFYNEINMRGGCDNGYCEMPIGVEQEAYTKFKNKDKMFCHGCKGQDPHCCVNTNQGTPAFKGDKRPIIERFVENDELSEISSINQFLKTKVSNMTIKKDGWIETKPDLYIIDRVSQILVKGKYNMVRAYPLDTFSYKKDMNWNFNAIIVLDTGRVIQYEAILIYKKPVFLNAFVMSQKISLDQIELQSYASFIKEYKLKL